MEGKKKHNIPKTPLKSKTETAAIMCEKKPNVPELSEPLSEQVLDWSE